MNATPPEANSEYSRGPEPFEGDFSPQVSAPGRRGAASSQGSGVGAGRGAGVAILAGGLLGALLLLVAEFTTLFEVSSGRGRRRCKSVGTGSHHAYALVPIALLAAALAYGVWRVGSRPALLSIGVSGRDRVTHRPARRPARRSRQRADHERRRALRECELEPERRAVHGDARRRGPADHLRVRIPPHRSAAPPGATRRECPHPDSRGRPTAPIIARGRYIQRREGCSIAAPGPVWWAALAFFSRSCCWATSREKARTDPPCQRGGHAGPEAGDDRVGDSAVTAWTTSGSGRRPCWPAPCGKRRPCA